MKIGIVTFCEAVNYGAYLQAFSLGEYLRIQGHEVAFIKSNSLKSLYWQFHNLYAYHLNRIKFRNEFRHKWLVAKKKLSLTTKKTGYDLLIIGSDEMWQLSGNTVRPLPVFWGIGIEAKKKITYAVCSNGTTVEQTREFEFIKDGIKSLDAISVRDAKTKSVFQPLTDKKIMIHVDPTFLIELQDYAVKPTIENFILVYTYSFSNDKIEMAKDFAKATQKQLVAVGNKFDWCDVSLPASPFEALGYFSAADYVITDTFHGTVLATHFNRNFVSFADGKEKVIQFLAEFGLEERNVSVDDNLQIILKREINYEKVNKLIAKRSSESCDYLLQFISQN